MPARPRAPRRAARLKRTPAHVEWIGGRLSPPFFIHDREEPYRAELVLWMELPTGLVVGQEVIHPREAAGAVSRALRVALEQPLAGPARRPAAIRVGDAALAEEIRAATDSAIPVVVGPTPELDELLELMIESSLGEPTNESYLGGGRIPEASVRELFAATRILFRMAPWTVASDSQVLRLDIPALDVEGACLSIIGQLGQSQGILIFPSLAGYEAFLWVANAPRSPRRRIDFGTGWLALNIERAEDLPESMRREAEAHGWPVAGPEAYPRIERLDPDGAARPLVERDLKIAAACATSLAAFFVKHRAVFEAERFDPICESYFDEHDLEVRFTVPYEALSLFDVEDARRESSVPPRRDASSSDG